MSLLLTFENFIHSSDISIVDLELTNFYWRAWKWNEGSSSYTKLDQNKINLNSVTFVMSENGKTQVIQDF